MIAVAVGNDGQFRKFAELLGRGEWGTDAHFARNQDRVVNRQELDRLIGAILRTEGAQTWIERLQAAGIPCGCINSVAQALSGRHTEAREMVRTIEHPVAGEIRTLGIPFRFSDTPTGIRRAPPTLSQHTAEVLRDELGYSDEQIGRLRRDGVV
jgi:formyl-CoA transferase